MSTFSKRYIEPELQSLGDGTKRARLVKTWYFSFFYRGRLYCFTVPAGFITDGSSLPIGLIYGKYDPRTWVAFLVHDYLYFSGLFSQKEADILYKLLLIEGGIKPYKAKYIVYPALRAVGGVPYHNHRKAEKENFQKHCTKHGVDSAFLLAQIKRINN